MNYVYKTPDNFNQDIEQSTMREERWLRVFQNRVLRRIFGTKWEEVTGEWRKLYHHHLLPPWIRAFDLFRYRRNAIVSWGVHDLFFLEVCS